MKVFTKRWNDPRGETDGCRILVTRFRPRALPKSEETWDAWMKEVAPSAELVKAFYGTGRTKIPWAVYRTSYLREMRDPKSRQTIAELAQRAKSGETITLLCSSHCVQES